ncbi:MAG: 7-cyano-7-deazaguanine synthase QueC [Pseudomonadota bacterium]
MTGSKAAVLLLSGGLDSATVLAHLKAQGYSVHALSFRYGQRHAHELLCATSLAKTYQVTSHQIIDIDLGVFGGSALTSDEYQVPKHDDVSDIGAEIPVTYVPARNLIFLSFAVAKAEVAGAREIFLGVNALDYSGYPDCRPDFIAAFAKTANLATRVGQETQANGVAIRTPLIDKTKAEIIALGLSLGVDYGATTSCYDPTPDNRACGRCDACLLRLKGFQEAGADDPIRYVTHADEALTP